MAEKGVVIVACGNPIYGNMAFNLAMSIKHNSPCDITCLYSESSLSELSYNQLRYFDKAIEVPAEYYTIGDKKAYQRIKCYVNELTPYKKTIMIDADTIWNIGKSIQSLWAECGDYRFQIGCLGKWEGGIETFPKYTYWARINKIREYWGIELVYKTYSGIVYWDDTTNEIWKHIQKVYDDADAPCDSWGGDKPDEYAFNIGISLSGYALPRHEYMPIFFGYTGYKYTEHLIAKNFLGLSVAGAYPDPYLITAYEQLMRAYSSKTGVSYKPYVKKGEVLEERKKF